MNFKTKIAILVIFLIVIAIIVLSFFSAPKPNVSVQNVNTGQQIIPSLPFSQSSETVKINDVTNKEEIRKAFGNFLEKAGKNSENFLETKFVDASQNGVALKDFTDSVDSSITPEIEKLVRQENYSVFSCQSLNRGKDYGIVLNVGRFKAEDNIKYETIPDRLNSGIENWGATILRDFHNILFPGINFSEQQLGQKIDFKQGRYLYGEVALPDGSKKSINFTSIGDPIIITTSPECMDMAIEKIADDTEQ